MRKFIEKKKDTVNILTHCNAGWLATIDWGTATQLPTFSHKIVEEFVPRYNAGTVTMTDVIKALQANNPTDEFQIADIQEAVKLQGHTLAR